MKNLSPRLFGPDAPLTKLPPDFPREIDDKLFLGIDLGIGSCGLALVSHGTNLPPIRGFEWLDDHIRFMGVRAFDVPETKEKTGPKLKNPERRQARLVRRGIARRALRVRTVRAKLISQGTLPPGYNKNSTEWAEKHESATPWLWRVDGLSRTLTPWEWAAVLIHFAKHRGFRSNRKSDLASKGEPGGVLESSKENHEALEHYRTLGEMFHKDERFSERKRNRDGSYVSVILREDLIAEIRILFAKQRELGNLHANQDFEREYIAIVQMQKPLQDPAKLLEDCQFEAGEKRGSRHAPSFELSRALQKLNSLVLVDAARNETPLPLHADSIPGAYDRFVAEFGLTKKISWKSLRKTFAIPEHLSFRDLSGGGKKGRKGINEATESDDFANRGGKGCAYATSIFRDIFSDHWGEFVGRGFELLDEAAFALTFYEVIEDGDAPNTILAQVASRCSTLPLIVQRIRADLESDRPTLSGFSGSVAVSSKVSRAIIPHLAQGLTYDKAMAAAGYTHTNSNLNLKSITNPVVQSVVREAIKQVMHLIHEAGRIPGRINVELARDLGKGIEERNEIKRGLDDRTNKRNANRRAAAELLETTEDNVFDSDLLKYELALSQGFLCPYTGETISRDKSLFRDANYQIDHILPRSRSHDNSFDNRVLVLTKANQDKKQQSPYEWLGGPDDKRWLAFTARIDAMPGLRGKKRRNLLETRFDEKVKDGDFLERNLNDTRYISRVVTAFLNDIYLIAGEKPPTAKGSRRRVLVRPGALTSIVRKAWDLENLKKDVAGNRVGDKHHAVDALVCACIAEKDLQFVTDLAKSWGEMERIHEHRLIPLKLPLPWAGFRKSVVATLDRITVSRREDCGGRGSLHDDTVYGRDAEGTAWKRTPLITINGKKKDTWLKSEAKLAEIRGARLEDVAGNPKDTWFRDALLAWIKTGSKIENPPFNPEGKPITKVFVKVAGTSLRKIDRGWVSNGNMIRCDVFSKNGKYALIPVYSHHLRNETPPVHFIKANKPESDWGMIDETYQFEFSLWKNSRFIVKERPRNGMDGAVITGNYVGVDRSTAAVTCNSPEDHGANAIRLSPVTSLSFQKLHVDRLGRVFPIKREKRTWRGKVFT